MQYQSNRKSEAHREPNKPQDTVTPVCISWILDAAQNIEDDVVKIDGVIMDKMSVCGRIIEHSATATKSFISIDDGTGVIVLICNKKYDEQMPRILEDVDLKSANSYVRAVIDVNSYEKDNQRTLVYTGIRFIQIHDHNYISYHLLNAIVAAKTRKEGFITHNEPGRMNADANRKESAEGSVYMVGGVYEVLRQLKDKTRRPVKVGDIVNAMGNRMNLDQVKRELEYLVGGGDIYRVPGTTDAYDLH